MRAIRFLLGLFLFLTFNLEPETLNPAQGATGCGYPTTLDTFTNVATGQILTAADYNRLLCVTEKLQTHFRLPNYTVSTLPSSPALGQQVYVTDAIDTSTCSTGGGSTKNVCVHNGSGWIPIGTGGGGGAPTGAGYITKTPDGTLSAEFALSTLATGLLRNTTGTGVPTIATEGTHYYAPGGTDVAIADGGTGASTAANARTNLGLVVGTNVFTQRTFQNHANVLTWTNADGTAGNPTPAIANSLIDGSSHFAQDSGSSDDYVACPLSISTMSVPAYVDRSFHGLVPNTANTGAASVNLCTLGVRAIVKVTQSGISTPLATGDMLVGGRYWLTYNSASSNFQLLNPSTTTGGTGTPGGSTTQCQYNKDGVFAGDAGCIYDDANNIMTVSGGYVAGNPATNSVNTVMGGGISGAKTYTQARNADMDYAGTTGTLTDGDLAKFNASGLLVRAGTAQRVAQFIIGADNESVLVDGDDQAAIFYNHYGQGITVNSVWCQSDGGTPTINLQKDDGSPVDMLSSALTCATGAGATSTSFSGTENQIASTNRINFLMGTAGGVAKRVTISIRYTLD